MIFSLLGLTIAEKWSTGGMTTLIGLGMTFIILAILIGCIFLLRYILLFLEKNNPKIKAKLDALKISIFKKKKGEDVVDDEPTETIVEAAETVPSVDEETMTVIEQSVKKYVSSSATDGKPHDRIKIVSVKEVNNE